MTPSPASPQPSRHLDLEGSTNVRDLGGYPTVDGRRTRWGVFLRSATTHRLTPESQQALLEYGIRTVIDLRRATELQEQPSSLAGLDGITYHHQDLIGDDPLAAEPDNVGTGVEARMLAIYGKWLDRRQAQFRETLATLARPGALPALYHCAGGKDRTGLVSALILGLARVPADVMAEDYALSARYLIDRYFEEQASPDLSPDAYSWEDYRRDFCPPEAMLMVLRHIDERYGGPEGYAQTIGLSQDEIDSLRAAIVG